MVSTRERLLRYSALYGDDDDVEAILTQGQKYNPVSSLESTFSNTIQVNLLSFVFFTRLSANFARLFPSSFLTVFFFFIKDIEDDIRNWRYAASSVLNRFTTGKPSNVELSTLANRYSSEYERSKLNLSFCWPLSLFAFYFIATLAEITIIGEAAPVRTTGQRR